MSTLGIGLSILFLITSKPAFAPLGLLLGLWNLRLLTFKSQRPVGLLLLLLVLSLSILYLLNSTPRYITYANRFNAIFSGVLSTSQNAEQDLRELGLRHPRRLSRFAGRNYWQPNIQTVVREDPGVIEDIMQVSHLDILQFYALHPERFIRLIRMAGEGTFELRLSHLSNYEYEVEPTPLSQSQQFNLWSSLRRNLLPQSYLVFIAFFVLSGLGLLRAWFRLTPDDKWRLVIELALVCLLSALAVFAVAVLAEGTVDLCKHLLLFNLALDCGLLLIVFYALNAVGER